MMTLRRQNRRLSAKRQRLKYRTRMAQRCHSQCPAKNVADLEMNCDLEMNGHAEMNYKVEIRNQKQAGSGSKNALVE